ncbi:MAG: hypothetical protein RJA08_555, partial [Pseudomonadota bacterium]
MNPNTHPPIDLLGLPFFWQEGVLSRVHLGENVLAWLEVDLNDELSFKKTLLILTDQRVISADEAQNNWNFWTLTPDLVLRVLDHAGVGTLALYQAGQSLGAWRFTLGLEAAVLRWKLRFENHLQGQIQAASFSGQSLAPNPSNELEWSEPGIGQMLHSLCPVCQNVVDASDEECSVCFEKDQAPTPTWTLFKLWRFARPYRGQLLLGFVLTLASTAATLVPPYLTMPLMDDVLIPYQNGKSIEPETVTWYLLALLASAIVAWGLGWVKTYILALVSERIGADLRTTTYQHLLKLSLEYFGGRRTGDLIARIGSETDRINVFLSLHLLDFATDVLMIMMTAVILFSINPTLALVTLLPLPFIGWLIHVVRERLRTGFEKIDRVWSEVTNVLTDTIPGIRVVKAFAQEDREAQRFLDANKHNLAVNDRLNRVWSLFSPTVTL